MKIYTEVIYFWDDDKGELVQESSKFYDYDGPLTLANDSPTILDRRKVGIAITTETTRSLARRHAVDLIEQLSSVALAPTDGSPAELRNIIKASVELLKIAGLYDQPTINVYPQPSFVEIANRAIREGTRPPHPWELGGELRLR